MWQMEEQNSSVVLDRVTWNVKVSGPVQSNHLNIDIINNIIIDQHLTIVHVNVTISNSPISIEMAIV